MTENYQQVVEQLLSRHHLTETQLEQALAQTMTAGVDYADRSR